MAINELRVVLTVNDFARAVSFFRDALGLEQVGEWQNDGGQAVLLDAGHATLEIFDQAQADAIDKIEVGRRVAGPIRVAFQVSDSSSTAKDLVAVGAKILSGPVTTPWGDRDVRLLGPDEIR